ncbi:MAG: penicillin-binding protein, partial [Gaiellaceae bacterium]|nr:penicillin-binding protein [Gaiellaceae bacterium]
PGLGQRKDNELRLVAEYTVKRGKIFASDGKTVLARNKAKKSGGKTLYFRRYPTGGLFAHAVGYSTAAHFRTGVEQSLDDYLVGADNNLGSVLRRTKDNLLGATLKGSDVVLTLNAKAQRVAMEALGSNCGAVVALEPGSGKVLVLASKPTYDPNLIENHFAQVAKATTGSCGGPLLNRATAALYSPGSSFKVVTMAAALESGKYTPESAFDDPGYCTEYGKKVYNFGADQGGPEVFGHVTLAQALQHSINAVFCQLGQQLGPFPILDEAKKFGFYSLPPLDTPPDERKASGLISPNGHLFEPSDPNAVDVGRLAFGQERRLLVTPLQMAMVAAGIGNDGIVMQPQLLDRVVAPNGSLTTTFHPHELGRAVTPEHAQQINLMMQSVVSAGTGTAAQIPGIPVAGKTGTAETGTAHVNTTWFICFAPADNPKVAVAVALERQRGVGGTTAAPIAKLVLQALLSPSGTP